MTLWKEGNQKFFGFAWQHVCSCLTKFIGFQMKHKETIEMLNHFNHTNFSNRCVQNCFSSPFYFTNGFNC